MSSAEEKMLDPPPAAQPSGSRFESYVLIDWSRPAELSGVLVLAVLLCYASGLPLLLVSVLQQMGQLPSLSCTGFWTALFPVSAGQFKEDSLKGIDLLAPNYLILALPWFVLSILWEGLMLRFIVRHRPRHLPRLNDTLISLSLGVLNQAVTAVVFLGWVGPLYSWLHRHIAIVQLDANSKAAWWGSLVMYDLCYYWWHRWSHHFSWLWTDHVVHHSSEEYNLATALRQPFNAFATPDTLISVMPLALFFPWQLASMHVSLSLLYQFWIHTSLVPPTPWFELLFNSPSLHRIHHIRNPELLGKNYGAILSVGSRSRLDR